MSEFEREDDEMNDVNDQGNRVRGNVYDRQSWPLEGVSCYIDLIFRDYSFSA